MTKENLPSFRTALSVGMQKDNEYINSDGAETLVCSVSKEDFDAHINRSADIWEEMAQRASSEYHPEDVSDFVYAHHVVCAVESKSGKIFTGFCIESASGVMNLCAERVALLNMYLQSGETVVKCIIAFRSKPPYGGGSGMPCGACREFLVQLNKENLKTEIMLDCEKRETITFAELIPLWWGDCKEQQ